MMPRVTFRGKRIVFALALSAALPLIPAAAADSANPFRLPQKLDGDIRASLDDLFNLRFSEAERRIDAFQDQADAHPMAALVKVVFEWWKITVQVSETDEAASRPFIEAGERCLELTEGREKVTDRRGEARFCAGTTLGLMSRWSGANRAWLAAYRRGSRGASLLEEALEENPAATDAYMTLGTFNYAREVFRKRLGTAPETGRTEVREGIRQLRRAHMEGDYFRAAAGLILAGLLANESPHEALPVLRRLREDLPASPVVLTLTVTALYNTGDGAALAKVAGELEAGIASGLYGKWFLPQARFARALVEFRLSRWAEAARLFADAARPGDKSNPYCTWARLYHGYALDAMGRREAAKEKYREVAGMPSRYASRELAEQRLKRPFRAGDPELKKLLL